MLRPSSRQRFLRNVFLPLAVGLGLQAAMTGAPRAAEGLDFIVPDSDGYGIADCMKPGMECGHVIADAWCEAHGHGRASMFGLTDDVTGSTKVSTAAPTQMAAGAVIIRCGE